MATFAKIRQLVRLQIKYKTSLTILLIGEMPITIVAAAKAKGEATLRINALTEG